MVYNNMYYDKYDMTIKTLVVNAVVVYAKILNII